MVNSQDVLDGAVSRTIAFRVSLDLHERFKRSTIRGGEILLTLVGANFGRVAIAPKSLAGFNCSRAVGLVPVVETPDFVAFCLRSSIARRYMDRWANTTAQPTFNLKDVASLPIPFPPISERLAIAGILGELDDKIELNKRMNQTLEAAAAAIFKAWFIDFEPVKAKAARAKSFPSMPQSVFDGLPSSIVVTSNAPMGELPKGWSIATLGDVVEQKRDAVEPSEVEPSARYIGLEHMPRGSISLDQSGAPEDVTSLKMRFKKGDILFGKLRPYFKKVGIPGFDGICSSDIIVASPKSPSDLAFAIGHLSSQPFIDYTDRCSNGAKMPRVNWSDMARYEVVVGDPKTMEAASDLFRPLLEQIHVNIAESNTLTSLRDTLLPKLLSGEVRVTSSFGAQKGVNDKKWEAIHG